MQARVLVSILVFFFLAGCGKNPESPAPAGSPTPGATAKSALKNCRDMPAQGGVVLVEIGGNDLLGGTPSPLFASDLDRLLAKVCQPGRTVLMFELPLPPNA